jgi:GTPase SAR1 family protein
MNKVTPIKIWLLGDHSVGKTSFIYKLIMKDLPLKISPTIGKIN